MIAILSPLSQLNSTQLILISGSCKKKIASKHAVLLQTIVDGANAKKDTMQVWLVSLASDGESYQEKALTKLTYIILLAPTSPIYAYLVNFDLLNLFVSVDDLTANKNYKHIFKQLCNTLLQKKGSIVYGVRLTYRLIRRHLQNTEHSATHIEHVLNPTNKQDIVLVYIV